MHLNRDDHLDRPSGCPHDPGELVDGDSATVERPEAGMTFADVAAQACRGGEPATGFHRYEDSNTDSATKGQRNGSW